MSFEATVWTLLATLFAGVHIFTSKVVAQKGINISVNSMFNFILPSFVWLLLLIFIDQKIPEHYLEIIFYSTLGGISYGISFLTRTYSLKNIDSVIFFPINKILGPLIAVIGGVFYFKEYLSLTNYFGVMLSILVPVLLINNKEKTRQKNLFLGIILLIVSTFTGTITHFFTKTSLAFGQDGFFLCLAVGQFVGFLVSYILYIYENSHFKIIFTKKDLKYGTMTAFLGSLAIFAISKAIMTGPISIVYTIHAHYILIPILLSVFFYKEHIDTKKVLAVLLSMSAIAFLI